MPGFAPHLHELIRSALAFHGAAMTSPVLATTAGWGLTRRENEVATWVRHAKSNREIAIILGMERRTVEKHMERILGKLGVENRTAAALLIATQDERAES